jgi:methylase of polypeptide subunit release factors
METARELARILDAAGYDEGRPGTLADLFGRGLSVELTAAREALRPLEVDDLEAEGLLSLEDGSVHARMQITPWLGVLVAHDPDNPAALGPDHVPGANTSADTLARTTVRLPVATALDLGAGSGIHALLAAGHTKRVKAVDVNPRAQRYATLNARLNGLANVETRQGNWLEPVAHQCFDLVVCNPPYVLSPDRDYLFRDGGDGLAERLVRAVPGHLTEGGFGHVLCNWTTRSGDSPWAPIEEWTRDSGCDVLVVAFGSEGARSYAERWADPLGARDGADYAARVERWVAYYRRSGIDTIWFGLVLLRSRAGTNWFRGLGAPGPIEGSASAHLLRIVAAQDWLASAGRPAPLAERFRLAPGCSLVHETAEGSTRTAIELDEGLGVHGPIDPGTLSVIERLDGERPLGELVAADGYATIANVLHLLELGLIERA